jgi:hypothetical protein
MVRILSIDGGGIKGLYSATVLDQLEKKFGASIAEKVDIISGTSIGGIIALGLACGKRPAEIVEFFERHGPRIFKPHNKWLKRFNRFCGVFLSVYGNKTLATACKEFFGDIKMGSLATEGYPKLSVCIPTANLISGKNCVFKTSHHRSFDRDQHYFVWQVALATSAAPYFLPVAEIEAANGVEYYVDGGLWSNNPSLVAITEALGYLKEKHEGISFDKIALFSLGNVPEPIGEAKVSHKRRGLVAWNRKLVNLPLTFQAEGSHNMVKLLLELNGGKYFRIEHNDLSADQKKLIGLDLAGQDSIALLKTLAINDVRNHTSPGTGGNFWEHFFDLGEDKHG